MPTTGVAQWTCAVSNLGFIYIYTIATQQKVVPSHGAYSSHQTRALYLFDFENKVQKFPFNIKKKKMGVIFINSDYKRNCLAGTGQLLITLIFVKLGAFSD